MNVMMDYYLEFVFPEKQIRYIAIAENEDTEKGLSEFVPFKNLFNEWFAKDTSRKVKSALHAKFEKGERIFAYAPLGYKRHPEIKNTLTPDEETRWIVRENLRFGRSWRWRGQDHPHLIAEKVPTAGWLNYKRYGTFANIYAGAPGGKVLRLDDCTGQSILKDETYIGNSIHNKQTNISYKNKKKVRKPKEEWIRVENTHEALVSKDVFDRVQELIETRRRKQKDGTTQIFSGLVKCADCGWSLAFGMNNQNKKPYGRYHCSNYGRGTGHCTMHYIRYDILYTYVLARIQYWSYQAQMDEGRLLQKLLKAGDRERTASQKKQAAELNKAEKRKAELDRLFAKMYEDWAAGRITEYNFNMLSQRYQTEQQELAEKIEKLNADLVAQQQSAVDAEKWVNLIKQYVNPQRLTCRTAECLDREDCRP